MNGFNLPVWRRPGVSIPAASLVRVVKCVALALLHASTGSAQTVSITSPPNGASLPACTTAAICAEATASTGAGIVRVDFVANGVVPLGSSASAPYCVNVANPPAGIYTLTAIVTDSNGQTATSVPVTVTLIDGPPVLNCPTGVTLECTGAQLGLTRASFEVTANDACDGPLAVTCVPPSGSDFAVGSHTVTCTATDSGGRTASCSFPVTVADTTPPVAHCNTNMTVDATSPVGAIVTYFAAASDPCGLAGFNCTPPTGVFPVGDTTVTCTALDGAGNAGSCSFTVTVRLTNQPPLAVIGTGQLIDLSPEFEHPVLISCNWWNACLIADGWTSSDPEGGDLTYLWFLDPDPVPFDAGPVTTNCLEVGVHTLLLAVTDAGGLTDIASQTIEVVTAPLAIDLLIEKIGESIKAGVTRKTIRELTATLHVATEYAGQEKLRETQKALDAFEKKIRAQLTVTHPEEATAWIRWSQAISEGMEKCIKPPRKPKDHPPKDPQNVVICHDGATIEVLLADLPAHLAHGDTLGPCVVRTVTVCHQGTTIEVPETELQSHLDHGDTLGACVVQTVTVCHQGATIEVPLSELQSHLDHGDTLGACPVQTVTVCHLGTAIEVPLADLQTHLDHGDTLGPCPVQMVTICHLGNTIEVPVTELQAHLDHGDTLGSCEN